MGIGQSDSSEGGGAALGVLCTAKCFHGFTELCSAAVAVGEGETWKPSVHATKVCVFILGALNGNNPWYIVFQ